mmetsp:Transcript_16708/g.39684  ORF Transcript_16708/g.39684 Transcript_16708/m.39684 type:complete len:82 (-) Transcript_16708:416-661(-)
MFDPEFREREQRGDLLQMCCPRGMNCQTLSYKFFVFLWDQFQELCFSLRVSLTRDLVTCCPQNKADTTRLVGPFEERMQEP